MRLCPDQRVAKRGRVAFIRLVHGRCQNDVIVEIDRVFRLVRHVRPAVFHPRDAGVGVVRQRPLFIRNPLVFPLLIELADVVIVRIVDAFFRHELAKIFLPIVAVVAADD